MCSFAFVQVNIGRVNACKEHRERICSLEDENNDMWLTLHLVSTKHMSLNKSAYVLT